ncbi:MAG TPA: DUF5916 domain-containing protein [Vicinamibacteria bacterium]|nr:DUF5916 domain-containing protein [Vicinamibacteria bacterium]
MHSWVLAPAALSLLSGSAYGRDILAIRTGGEIQIDGVLDDQEWQGASQADGFMQFEPFRGEAAREPTEAYVLYDDNFVYFGFRCHDSEPSRIAAQLTRRDSDLLQDDSVLVVVDTFHDGRSAYFFATNLLATQYDGRVTDNGRVVEDNWDATWYSAASRFEGGWTVEIAIPLVILRFSPGGDQTWGLNLGRTTRRLLESSFWTGPLEDRFRISQYGTLAGLDLRAARRKYEIIPYALARYQEGIDPGYEAGAEVRYSPTPQDLLNTTVNPDFAIIEADQEQINLTRFELSLPEKRPFFLEGAEQYQQRIRTFYSRRISDIHFGAKALGRRGDLQYSLLTAQSDPSSGPPSGTVSESANYTVGRLEASLMGGSSVALMGANRYLEGESRGSVGLDTALYFTPTFSFTGQLARSHGPEEGGRWAFFVRPSRDTSTSHVHFRYTHLGDRFGDHVNAIGFIRDDDRREMDSAINKDFWPRSGLVSHVEYDSNYNIYWSQKNVLRSWRVDQSLGIELQNRWAFAWDAYEEFQLFEKEFRNRSNGFLIGYNIREFQSASVEYAFGQSFDSDFDLWEVALRRKLGEALSVEYELTRLRLVPDPEEESTDIHVIRGVYNFTPDLFFKLFFQSSTAIDRKNVQAVFVWRYRPPFGTVQVAYERGTAPFGERSEQGNTVFLKFSYVF